MIPEGTGTNLAAPPSLYVHVPFCASKCHYCAFYSEPSRGEEMTRYVTALVREIRRLAAGSLPPKTLFFGGGTPSLLSLPHWERILEALETVGSRLAAEFTVECNPVTLSGAKARLLRQGGVNRLSLGVQSLDSDLLDRLGRVHSREAVFRSYDLIRQAGFDNVNLDLMFALPGQSLESWNRTLTEALALNSEHLSCYEVIYEEDTPLFRQRQTGAIAVDEELAAGMYRRLVDRTAETGFVQYEIANFARDAAATKTELPRRACRHNVNYWTGGEYYGLGPAAAGHLNGWRYQNWPSVSAYCRAVAAELPPRDPGERLSPPAKAGETAAFWLRMNRGIDLIRFRELTGYDFRTQWKQELTALVERGWGERRDRFFRLTPVGLRFADAAAAEFLSPAA